MNIKPKYKPKYVIENMEDINIGELYSFTINLAYQYDQIEAYINAYKYYLKYYVCAYAKVEMHYEISKTGRLHMHGVIAWEELDKIAEFYFKCIPEMMKISTFELSKIRDQEQWSKYIIKQSDKILSYLHIVKETNETVKDSKKIHFIENKDSPIRAQLYSAMEVEDGAE